MARAVISTIGHDRPGLIADITRHAGKHGLNIADSRMTVLGGEFAVIMSLTGELDSLRAFKNALESMTDENLACIYRETAERTATLNTMPYVASVVALDHPGIVAAIAGFFSARRINIHDLDTHATPAPHTGTPIFNVTVTAEVPATVKIRELRDAFEQFCDDNDLDGELEPAR